MFLFTRRVQIAPGNNRVAMAYATEMGAMASGITGHDISVWMTVASPEVGGIVYSTWFEHLDDLHAAFGALAASDDYNAKITENAHLWAGSPTDLLTQMIHGAAAEGGPPAFATSVRATAANGSIGAAMAAGVEIAEAANRITGLNTIFGRTLTGAYGGVGWITGAESMAAIEESQMAMAASEEWLALVDRVGPSFAPDATSEIVMRLG